MKRILFIMLVLLLVVPAAGSYSATIDSGMIWSDNRYYDSTGQYVFGILADTKVSNDACDVYMHVPSWTVNKYQKLEHYIVLGNDRAYKFFNPADGYFPPGDAYETKNIYFFIDEDLSGDFDESSDPYIVRYYTSGTFSQIPLVQNVNIFSAGSDTIVSWDGILDPKFGDGPNDRYGVSVIDKATNEFYFAGGIGINSLNKYAFNLGDLSIYGENLWIRIDASDITDDGLVNRSGYYVSVPEPATMLLLGTGLVILAGFGRKKFKNSVT